MSGVIYERYVVSSGVCSRADVATELAELSKKYREWRMVQFQVIGKGIVVVFEREMPSWASA